MRVYLRLEYAEQVPKIEVLLDIILKLVTSGLFVLFIKIAGLVSNSNFN